MSNRPRSLLGCIQVRIKYTEKTSVDLWGLVYDHRELLRVITVTLRVTGVLQMVLELTLIIPRARTGQLIRIW
jgi:hypothetical protein